MTNPPLTAPVQQPGASVPQDAGQLAAGERSASQAASPAHDGEQPCPRTSFFAIRVIDDKDAVVEGLTLKLKLPELGEVERVTSRAADPLKVEQLKPGGKGGVKSIDAGEFVWVAVGDFS